MLSLLDWLRSHDRTFTTRSARRRRFPSRSSRPRCVLPRLEPLEDRLVPDSSAFGYGPPTPTPVPAPTPTPPPAALIGSLDTFAKYNSDLAKVRADQVLYAKALLDVSADVTVLAGKYYPTPQTLFAGLVAETYLEATKGFSKVSGLVSYKNHLQEGQYGWAAVDLISLADVAEANLVADLKGLHEAHEQLQKDLGQLQPPMSLPAPTPVLTPTPTP